MKQRTKYIVLASIIGFFIWLIGELLLMFKFTDSSLFTHRLWAIVIFVGTCIWCVVHFYRSEKKKREDEDNENYKGVY